MKYTKSIYNFCPTLQSLLYVGLHVLLNAVNYHIIVWRFLYSGINYMCQTNSTEGHTAVGLLQKAITCSERASKDDFNSGGEFFLVQFRQEQLHSRPPP